MTVDDVSEKLHDVFISYAHADAEPVDQLVKALRKGGLKVWIDTHKIEEFEGISDSIRNGLAQSKLFLAWYSLVYPTRPACQWELTTAFTAFHQATLNPLTRLLVINPEPSPDHITPFPLRDQKYATPISTTADNFSAITSQIKQKLTHITSGIGLPSSSGTARVYGRSGITSLPNFVGRLRDLWDIHGHLWSQEYQIASQKFASPCVQIVGFGGIGKSLLAQEYVARFGAAYKGGVFWIDASELSRNQQALKQDDIEVIRSDRFASIARTIGIEPGVGSSTNSGWSSLENRLADGLRALPGTYLWIIDDVPSGLGAPGLAKWLPLSENGKTLITTKSTDYTEMSATVELKGLGPDAALQLLTTPLKPSTESECLAAKQVALQELGGHPLAIAVASKAVKMRGGPLAFTSYLTELKQDALKTLKISAQLRGALPNGHEKSIVSTISMSITQLPLNARGLLHITSLAATTQIPCKYLIRTIADVEGLGWVAAKEHVENSLAEILGASLGELTTGDQPSLNVHILVSRVGRLFGLAEDQLEKHKLALCRVLMRELSLTPNPRIYLNLTAIIPVAIALSLQLKDSPERWQLVAYVAQYQHLTGSWRAALSSYNQALAHWRELRHFHKRFDIVARGHAKLLSEMGDFESAFKMYGKMATMFEEFLRTHGSLHPNIFSSTLDRAKVVSIYEDPGKAVLELNKLVVDSSAGSHRNFQRRNPILRLYFGRALRRQGRHPEAFLQLSAATRQIAGETFEGSPLRLEALFELIEVHLALGWLEEQPATTIGAVSYSISALTQAARVWGWCHPYTVEALELLARCYGTPERRTAVLPIVEGVLKTCTDALPGIRTRLTNLLEGLGKDLTLAGAYKVEHVSTDGDDLLESLLSFPSMDNIEENASMKAQEHFGSDSLLGNLGKARQLFTTALRSGKEGDGDYTVKILEEIVYHYERTRGVYEQETLLLKRELGNVLSQTDDHVRAWAIHEEILEFQIQKTGQQSIETTEAAWNLVVTLIKAEQFNLARPVLLSHLLWLLNCRHDELDERQASLIPQIKTARAQIEGKWITLLRALKLTK